MEAKELRIGNLIEFLGKVVFVEGLNKLTNRNDLVWIQTKGNVEYKSFHFKPIPLTEQWLLDFGFEKSGGDCRILFENNFALSCFPEYDDKTDKDGFTFIAEQYLWDGGLSESEKRLSDSSWFPIVTLYVHQLQNLYFALTGTELILNK